MKLLLVLLVVPLAVVSGELYNFLYMMSLHANFLLHLPDITIKVNQGYSSENVN